ncbi:MAG: hypothetical protein BGP12_10835 [Rhodospirillales bacterium 70-18]|nr:GNAT family N-acetyltransferase [Rhodospirillales bacterium]OJY66766.1 MAG: hypothetical protein BGP12_10835 [Rhodospirillales bacterium 70-18]
MTLDVTLADGYRISDDPALLDLDAIHAYLAGESYWALGRSRAVMERGIAHALCLGLYAPGGAQAGFAKIVIDRAVAAHLGDVFVLPPHRGGGRGVALVRAAIEHPELLTVQRWTLTTRDAHTLYERFGFERATAEHNLMTRLRLAAA